VIAPRTWSNKPGATVPDWLTGYMIGGLEANGSFLIKSRCGTEKVQARVKVGDVVVEQGGVTWSRSPDDVRQLIDELKDAALPPPPTGKVYGDSRTPNSGPKRITAAGNVRTMAYSPPVGSRPSIEWVFTTELSVDEGYQRRTDNEASRRLIASIAAKFDWRLFGVLTVSRRPDGSLKVIDGQHRWTGAAMRGDIDQVPCCLSRFETVEDEAKFFIVANRARKPMNRLDDFHAALAAADDDAMEIQRLVTEAGLKVTRVTASAAWSPGEIAFTAAIARALRMHGAAVVSAALTNIAEAFPGQKLTHGGSIFNGLVRIIASPPDGFDPDRLFQALMVFDADGWGSFMTGLKGGDTRGHSMKQAMLEAYADVGLAPAQAA